MKACIIQPGYTTDYSLSDQKFEWTMAAMDACDDSLDLIVLPEAADVPAYAPTKEQYLGSSEKYREKLLEKASKTAKRCNAVLFINALRFVESGYRNTTYAFNRQGEQVGYYYKQHVTPGETNVIGMDSEYSYDYEPITVVEIDGIRYGFLICYDFYFYEMFAKMARANLDVIIGCSNQRTDSHEALEMMTRFCAYNTGAYIVRASLSMGEDKTVGGCSMIVTPKGEILTNALSKTGAFTAEFNPHEKYLKPAGFGNPPSQHYEYVETGRRPWKYRNNAGVVRYDDLTPYPRICAHRGFSTVAPENSMPAFASAIALGAEEIEFDLWRTADGKIVSCHDDTLDRVSNGSGKIYEKTYDEIKDLDFGFKFSEKFAGLKIPTFEEILKQFGGRVIMNIHIKDTKYPESYFDELVALLDKYDCRRHAYFMISEDYSLKLMKEKYPDVKTCCGEDFGKLWQIVDRAIEQKCDKVQLFKPYFNQEMIDKAHAHGIKCNVFWSDDPEEAQKFLDMGIDCILTNDFLRIKTALK